MASLATRINAELRGDRGIWAIIVILSVFSLLTVYSSAGTLAYRYHGGNTEAFLFKHGIILLGGLLMTYLCSRLYYLTYSRAAPALLLLSLPILIYTLFYGVEINEARRWVELPLLGISFQTSDFARVALLIYIAREISSKQEYIKDFGSAFVPIIVPILIICGLIAPFDLSSAVLLFFTCMLVMFVGRVAIQYILLLLLLGLVVFSMLVFIGQTFPEYVRIDTWASRIREFVMEPEGGYQVQQAKIAIANGEWLGRGPGNSIQRYYLPASYSDFIFAIICEEYGIFGGATIILLYAYLFFRITRLVTKSHKAFGAMLAMGLGISLVFQAYANIAVALNLLPVTGLTLPMISMGGTSIMFTCISFGIILSISKYVESLKGVVDEE
jgi:cell division protein FtsW